MRSLLKSTLFIIPLILLSCSPKISTHITSSAKYPALDYNKEVYVFGMGEELPPILDKLGEVKIGDNGLSTNCSYEQVIETAKNEARKAGGNSLLITEHKLPSTFGSSCHRIKAQILFADIDSTFIAALKGSSIEGADYALFHIYRLGTGGVLINYDLKLGDSTICRVKNNSAETVSIKKMGSSILSAETETKTEIPIEIELGKEYYIRCGLSVGFVVGRPSIDLVDPSIGKREFKAIHSKNQK